MGSKNQRLPQQNRNGYSCGRDSVRVGSRNLSSFLIPPSFKMPARGRATPAPAPGVGGKGSATTRHRDGSSQLKCEDA